jgi:hypothetical protein
MKSYPVEDGCYSGIMTIVSTGLIKQAEIRFFFFSAAVPRFQRVKKV